jgi:hypothetical protein
VLFHGCSFHEITADDAVRFVSQFAEYDRDRPDHGYSFIFPALQLSLWRPVMPSDVGDIHGHHFDAVGVGMEQYFGS